jgi:hypothetical protein
MKTGLDSAYPPTPAQIAAAKAGGYSAWLGYFAGPNILNGWADQDFINVYNGGLMTAAYCSGWADPLQMKARADHLTQTIPGFVGMLDDESGIRSLLHGASGLDETDLTYQDAQARRLLSSNRLLARSMMHGGGARPVLEKVNGVWTVSGWVQPWLNSSGFGQYGNEPVFAGVHASRYVFAAYLGIDPGLSWPNYYPRPSDGHPCAWQFQGTTSMFGRGVDLTHFDDNFWAFGPSPHNVTEDEMLYVGDFHKLPSPIVLAVYADGQNSMPDPSAAVPLVGVGALAKGASIQVDGYVFSTSPVQSTIPAGLDYC